MAAYTLYAGAVRPAMGYSFDSINYYYPVTCDVLLIGENDVLMYPGNDTSNVGGAQLSLTSVEPIEYGDTIEDFRRKIMGNFAPQYPQLTEEDTVTVVWI